MQSLKIQKIRASMSRLGLHNPSHVSFTYKLLQYRYNSPAIRLPTSQLPTYTQHSNYLQEFKHYDVIYLNDELVGGIHIDKQNNAGIYLIPHLVKKNLNTRTTHAKYGLSRLIIMMFFERHSDVDFITTYINNKNILSLRSCIEGLKDMVVSVEKLSDVTMIKFKNIFYEYRARV